MFRGKNRVEKGPKLEAAALTCPLINCPIPAPLLARSSRMLNISIRALSKPMASQPVKTVIPHLAGCLVGALGPLPVVRPAERQFWLRSDSELERKAIDGRIGVHQHPLELQVQLQLQSWDTARAELELRVQLQLQSHLPDF